MIMYFAGPKLRDFQISFACSLQSPAVSEMLKGCTL